MTALNFEQLDEKQDVINGKLTQAKGIVREQLAHVQNDELARLAGKKDQIVGQLEAKYGQNWFVRNRRWVLATTAVTFVSAMFAFILLRRDPDSEES